MGHTPTAYSATPSACLQNWAIDLSSSTALHSTALLLQFCCEHGSRLFSHLLHCRNLCRREFSCSLSSCAIGQLLGSSAHILNLRPCRVFSRKPTRATRKRHPVSSLFRHPTSSPTLMLSSHHTHPFRISRSTLFSHIRPKTSLVSLTLIRQTQAFHQGTSFLRISKRMKITAFYTRYAGLRLRKRSQRCDWTPHTQMSFPLRSRSPHWT